VLIKFDIELLELNFGRVDIFFVYLGIVVLFLFGDLSFKFVHIIFRWAVMRAYENIRRILEEPFKVNICFSLPTLCVIVRRAVVL